MSDYNSVYNALLCAMSEFEVESNTFTFRELESKKDQAQMFVAEQKGFISPEQLGELEELANDAEQALADYVQS